MNRVTVHRSQLAALFLAFLLILGVPTAALADDEVVQGSSIDGGETVENDVFLNGSQVTLDGKVAGDVVIVGRTVVINGDVEGSMVVLGENVIMNGQVEGSVYSIAVSFSHLSAATIGRSLYFLGVSLVTESDSQIGRDMTAVTLGYRGTGTVDRNQKLIAGLDIGRIVLDRINRLTTGQTSGLPGPSVAGSHARPAGGTEIYVGSMGPGGTRYQPAAAQEEPTAPASIGTWLVDRLRDLVTLLLVGGLLTWLFPGQLGAWAAQVRRRPVASGGWGLVAYIVGFAAPVIFLLLVVVVGISFAFVTLWSLALIWWGIGLAALLLYVSLFLAAVVLVSKVIVAFLFGQLLFERIGSRPQLRKPWPLLLGLVIYVLISGVPYLGWAFSLIVTLLGLGGIWLTFTSRNESAKPANAN